MKKRLLLKALHNKYRFDYNSQKISLERFMELGEEDRNQVYVATESSKIPSKGLRGSNTHNQQIEEKLEILSAVDSYLLEQKLKSMQEVKAKQLQEKLYNEADRKEVKEIVTGKTSEEIRKTAGNLTS